MTLKKKYIFFIGLALALIFSVSVYSKIYGDNVEKSGDLFIYTNDSLEQVIEKLSPYLKNPSSFEWVAGLKKYKSPKSGKYHIEEGTSNNDLINKLRIGSQTPVKVSFNNQFHKTLMDIKRFLGMYFGPGIAVSRCVNDFSTSNRNKNTVSKCHILKSRII